VMAVVVAGGAVRANQSIGVELPTGQPVPLFPV
jgi:hypothetical protein